MTSIATAPAPHLSGVTRRVLHAGLVAGALDLCLAMGIQFLAAGFVNLVRILHAIASGVLGPAARDGGLPTAAAGLVLHFLISTIWSLIFAAALDRLSFLATLTASGSRRLGTGLAYGVVIWIGMNYIVVPLSRANSGVSFTWTTALMIVGHAFMVGLPIVLIVAGRRPRER